MTTTMTLTLLQNSQAGYPRLWFTRFGCVQGWPELPIAYYMALEYTAAPTRAKLQAFYTFASQGQDGGAGASIAPPNLAAGALDPVVAALDAPHDPPQNVLDDLITRDYGIQDEVSGYIDAYNQANQPDGTFEGNMPLAVAQAIRPYSRALGGLITAVQGAGYTISRMGIPQPIT